MANIRIFAKFLVFLDFLYPCVPLVYREYQKTWELEDGLGTFNRLFLTARMNTNKPNMWKISRVLLEFHWALNCSLTEALYIPARHLFPPTHLQSQGYQQPSIWKQAVINLYTSRLYLRSVKRDIFQSILVLTTACSCHICHETDKKEILKYLYSQTSKLAEHHWNPLYSYCSYKIP